MGLPTHRPLSPNPNTHMFVAPLDSTSRVEVLAICQSSMTPLLYPCLLGTRGEYIIFGQYFHMDTLVTVYGLLKEGAESLFISIVGSSERNVRSVAATLNLCDYSITYLPRSG